MEAVQNFYEKDAAATGNPSEKSEEIQDSSASPFYIDTKPDPDILSHEEGENQESNIDEDSTSTSSNQEVESSDDSDMPLPFFLLNRDIHSQDPFFPEPVANPKSSKTKHQVRKSQVHFVSFILSFRQGKRKGNRSCIPVFSKQRDYRFLLICTISSGL